MPTVRLNSSAEIFTERPDLLNAAAGGISDVLVLQGLRDSFVISSGGFESAKVLSDFEQQHTHPIRNQVHLREFADDVLNNTSIRDSATPDFILLGTDLYSDGMNFVFGCTWPTHTLSVQSVARVVGATSDWTAQRLHTRHIARHEFAHMRGLNAPTDYMNHDRRSGIYSGHCANICTMRQSMNIKEAMGQARELDGHELAGFCVSCVDRLFRTGQEELQRLNLH